MNDSMNSLRRELDVLHRLTSIQALLDWDQQVNLPRAGGPARAAQLEYMASAVHARRTNPDFIRLVDQLMSAHATLSPDDQVIVRETYRVVDRARRLPPNFVADLSRTQALAYQAWVEARPRNDFSAIRSFLKSLLALKQREAELVGFEDNPYDALLDEYEPGMRFSQVAPLLRGLAAALTPLCRTLADRTAQYPRVPGVSVGVADQVRLNYRLLRDIGFPLDAGRLDQAPHPFMTNLGLGDTRLTTRYYEENFLSALFSTLHEAGHGLYEIGFPHEYSGTPLAMHVSLGIHESQSRLWENLVGRSRPFSHYLHKLLQSELPAVAAAVSEESLWQQLNRVTPSLIRVEADEVTYSLHVVVRMELEEALINGRLTIEELPEAWNDAYQTHLGVRSPTDRDGVMQDVHWFSGSLGYFPTYVLGNIYGAMMMEVIRTTDPDLDQQIAQGSFAPLLGWLREHVHRHGMRYRAGELVELIARKPVSFEPFVNYLRAKHQ